MKALFASVTRLGVCFCVLWLATPVASCQKADVGKKFQTKSEKPAAVKEHKGLAVIKNISLNKPVRASSDGGYATPEDMAKLVNGGADKKGFSFHTRLEPNPWVEIDLKARALLSQIDVLNRVDCCQDRAASLTVLISENGQDWKEVYQHDGTPFGLDKKPLRIKLNKEKARYVRLQLKNPNYLHLKQVDVYGEELGPVKGK